MLWKTRLSSVVVVLLALSWTPRTRGAQVTLTFEGLANGESVNNYYDGGTGSLGSGPGPNHGLTFANADALLQNAPGNNFANEPSPLTVISSNSEGISIQSSHAFLGPDITFYATGFGNAIIALYGANGNASHLLRHGNC